MYSEQLGIYSLESNRNVIMQQITMLRTQLCAVEEQLRYTPNDSMLVANTLHLNSEISKLEREANKLARKQLSLQRKLEASVQRGKRKQRV